MWFTVFGGRLLKWILFSTAVKDAGYQDRHEISDKETSTARTRHGNLEDHVRMASTRMKARVTRVAGEKEQAGFIAVGCKVGDIYYRPMIENSLNRWAYEEENVDYRGIRPISWRNSCLRTVNVILQRGTLK